MTSTAPTVSTAELDEYRAAFAVFDKNGDGTISTKELGAVMRSMGQNPTEAELMDMVHEVDGNGNGQIEFDEFVVLMTKLAGEATTDDDLREVFKALDQDGDGKINAEELRHVLGTLGEPLTESEIQELMAKGDLNNDGLIDYEEFVKMMMAPSSSIQ